MADFSGEDTWCGLWLWGLFKMTLDVAYGVKWTFSNRQELWQTFSQLACQLHAPSKFMGSVTLCFSKMWHCDNLINPTKENIICSIEDKSESGVCIYPGGSGSGLPHVVLFSTWSTKYSLPFGSTLCSHLENKMAAIKLRIQDSGARLWPFRLSVGLKTAFTSFVTLMRKQQIASEGLNYNINSWTMKLIIQQVTHNQGKI